LLVETIDDGDALHRRLSLESVTAGQVNSAAFVTNGRPDNQISVDLARLTTPEQTLRDRRHFGIGAILAGTVRQLGFEALHAPLEANSAHALIRGENSKAKCRQLAEHTVVLIQPKPKP